MSYEDITRERSKFWIRRFDNVDKTMNLLTNRYTYIAIGVLYSKSKVLSPAGWKSKGNGRFNLWIPGVDSKREEINDFIKWAQSANRFIWLGLNKNIEGDFSDELDFCIANDWNVDLEADRRTDVGEAEYQIKYNESVISKEKADYYKKILFNALSECFSFLPLASKKNLFVTSIPAILEEQDKLSWRMARYVQQNYGGDFLTATLLQPKPEIKSMVNVTDRINAWGEIYTNVSLKLSEQVQGKDILVVDDMYQSGSTMWRYAKYLKSLGARKVVGLVSVKAKKDRGDA